MWQFFCSENLLAQEMHSNELHAKQGVSITGRNTTGPPCSVGRPTANAPGRRRVDRPRVRRPAGPHAGSVTDDRRRQKTDDRRQHAKHYWPIRRASKNIRVLMQYITCFSCPR